MLEKIFLKCLSEFNYDGARLAGDSYFWETDSQLLDMLGNGTVTGICATFALLCRLELDKAGIANTLVYCQTETGGYHIVCSVDGMILDNRQQAVLSNTQLEQIGYNFISESGTHKGDQWFLIKH